MKPLLLLLALLFLFISCKKDKVSCQDEITNIETGDTIKSSEYIMAFPGSWWEYAEGQTMQCNSYQSSYFQTVDYVDTCYHATRVHAYYPQRPILIPFGNNIAGDFGLSYNTGDFKPTVLIPLIDTTLGEFYSSGGANSGEAFSLLDKFDTMTVNGIIYEDVLHIRYNKWWQTFEFQSNPMNHYRNYHCYYAKGVGLIKYTCTETFGNYTVRTLSNHYIAPH
ncbi:MAG: hypothetical protein V4638_09710 [Bacteroidota bacterium]